MKNKHFFTLSISGIIIFAYFSQFSIRSQETNLLTALITTGSVSNYHYLVNHGDLWHYRFGTNAPQSNWKTVSDNGLDSSWLLGPAGFGYEDNDDATILNNMSNHFTTLYIRRTFTVDSAVDPSASLQLVMDYDDAFIAWIDGIEVARSSNAPGTVGSEPPFNSVSLPPNHEALGYRGLPPEIYNLGTIGSRLQPGQHVLAIMGFNASLNSSDFSLIPDLRAVVTVNTALNGNLFSFASTNKIVLQGSNTVAGSTGVTVNGLNAQFNLTNKTWQTTADLQPGVNRFFIAAVDNSGNIIKGTNKYVVFVQNSTKIGGEVSTDISLPDNGTIVEITNNLIIRPSVTLTIPSGSILIMNPNASLVVQSGASAVARGSESIPIYIIPSDGSTPWGGIQASGENSSIYLSNVVVAAGQIVGTQGSKIEIYDSILSDLIPTSNRLLIASTNCQTFIIKRSRIANFNQMGFFYTPVVIEDCIFENIYSNGCGCYFEDSEKVIIKKTTFRYGFGANTDAIGLTRISNAFLSGLLIHHFPNRAISVSDFSSSIMISNSLLYSNGIAIYLQGTTNCVINQNTISDNMYGIQLQRQEVTSTPSFAIGTNNIFWANITNFVVNDNSVLELYYSDIQGETIYPGEGNLNEDPLFNNPQCGDYNLTTISPLIGKGFNGLNMGIIENPGGLPSEPINLVAFQTNANSIILKWADTSENELRFLLQFSNDGIQWSTLAYITANTNSYVFTNAMKDVRYYFRVRAENESGNSEFSNTSSAMIETPVIYYGGILTSNTTWGIENGVIIINSNLIVPTNITLTVNEGAIIKISRDTLIRATNGGRILINGSFENPVKIIASDSSATHREISAYGTNSYLTIRNAEIIGTQATVYQGATGLFEDSYFHDYDPSGADTFTHPIILTHYPSHVTIRRCYFKNYYELLLRNGLHLIEFCLFENATGDALDFDAAAPGTVVRQCTFRRGLQTNVDAIDIGNDGTRYSKFVTIESCIMHDFPFDKGVSIGDGASDIVVKNCLIFNCNSGIAVKDECTATIYNCTLISNTYGINLQAKYPAQYQGGRATNTFNNIIWGNQTQILVTNNPIIVVNYSDIQGTNWPGIGNISLNPLFRNPSEGDFRLSENSPCIGSGSNGVNMGVIYPIGGLPDVPSNFHASEIGNGRVTLSWEAPTNFYSGFVLEKSENGTYFAEIATLSATQNYYCDSSIGAGKIYYYRLKATNFIGSSFYTDVILVNAEEEQIFIDVSKMQIQAGALRIYINTSGEKTFVLEASENLNHWRPIFTNSPINGIVELLDMEAATHQKRFYRVFMMK